MKRFALAVLCIAAVLAFASCAKNTECEPEAARAALEGKDEVYAYVYADEKGYTVEADELAKMLSGEWTQGKRSSEAKKVLSVTVETQYEICLFDDGSAMIYCGYAQIYEKDRTYYTVKLDTSAEDICKYVRENGVEVEEEEKNNAPAAE